MPTKIVDLSARSRIIKDEPFHVHFWECTPDEFLSQLKNPRQFLEKMGVEIPGDCRIETTIENHDQLGKLTNGFASANGTIICNVGGGNIVRGVYRIVSFAHDHASIGKFEKRLLHSPEEEQVGGKQAY